MIRVEVWYEAATSTRRQLVGEVKVTNDGSARDGSGDSLVGNYVVEARWLPRGEKGWRKAQGWVHGFFRRQGVLVLLQRAFAELHGKIE